MIAAEATPLVHLGTILIPGIMHKRNIRSHAASMQSLGRCDNNSDDERMSDDGSNYRIDNMIFLEEETNDRIDTDSDGEEEINVMGLCWN
eukprot:7703613-Ditylum_brightwellii.AAC.1